MISKLYVEVSHYEGAELQKRLRALRSGDSGPEFRIDQGWAGRWIEDPKGRLEVEFRSECGAAAAATGVAWEWEGWSSEVYVLMPAGAYAGNRFRSIRVPYSPRVPEELVRGVDTPELITDVPRLSLEPGPSRIQLKSGDLAFPGFGWFESRSRRGWFVLAANPAEAADWLWEIEESDDRRRAVFRLASPGIRQSPVYRLPMMCADSPDCAVPWREGESRTLRLQVFEWHCDDLAQFFGRVAACRASLSGDGTVPAVLPFSAAFRLIEEHYNRDCWREAFGFYATDCNPGSHYAFQTGWCGGMIATLPLWMMGLPETAARARKTVETFFRNAPRPCGLFWGKCTREGVWTADFTHDKARPYTHSWTLTRRQADALWYLLKHLEWLETEDPAFRAPPDWDRALRAAADVFVRLWRKNRQFGQFLHQETGEILVGGSTSGALVPAALAAAWRRFREEEYLRVARESGRAFADHLLRAGYTNGGPGDALQNPDSESCAALVESFAELLAADGDPAWVEAGRCAAALLSTWVMPYDFPFPEGTEFARLNIRSRGSVFANTQNKHSAPGICTHAGVGLLHLFRATGDVRWMDLLRDIARFLPQVVSRPGCEIRAKDGRVLPSGWINERVNTSDWDDNIGGVFHGSTWSEVALLLTVAELPGVYARPDIGRVWCLDHVEAEIAGDSLILKNPTGHDAEVRVLVESRPSKLLARADLWRLPRTRVPAGGEARVPLS